MLQEDMRLPTRAQSFVEEGLKQNIVPRPMREIFLRRPVGE